MGGERHLLSNHADIDATIDNAIEHFLYVESFPEEQKTCLNLVSGARTFSQFFQRALEDLHFSTLSMNNERNQRKVGESISAIIIVAPLVAIMKPSSRDLE